MERELPIVVIDGINFYVDVSREELQQGDRPTNRISFNELEENEEGYSLIYDTEINNVPGENVDLEKYPSRYVRVILPALMELDPSAVAEKYAIPLELLSPNTEIPKQITAIIKPLKQRRSGKNIADMED